MPLGEGRRIERLPGVQLAAPQVRQLKTRPEAPTAEGTDLNDVPAAAALVRLPTQHRHMAPVRRDGERSVRVVALPPVAPRRQPGVVPPLEYPGALARRIEGRVSSRRSPGDDEWPLVGRPR